MFIITRRGGSGGGGGGGPAFTGNVVVTHKNGNQSVYQASANTDIARGTALASAVSAAVVGDSIAVGPGTFDIVTSLLTFPTGTISLIGAGIDVTKIVGQAILATGGGVLVSPGNNSFVGNMTITGNASAGNSQAAIGFRNVNGTQPPFTNVRAFNLRMTGETDVVYFNPGTASIGTSASLLCENCILETNFDASTILGGYTDQTLATLTYFNCDITATGHSDAGGAQSRCVTGTAGTTKVYNSRVTATGDATAPNAKAISARTSATIEVYNCNLSTTAGSGGTAYDLDQSGSGVVKVDQSTSFNPGKTNGSITWLTAPTASYASGANAISATSTAPTFTSGSLVLAGVPAGGYILRTHAYLEYAGATFSANNTITLSLVRTTPNQGTLTGSVVTIPTGTVTALIRPLGCNAIPDIIYNATVGENPTFALFAQITSLPTAGSVTLNSGFILAQSIR